MQISLHLPCSMRNKPLHISTDAQILRILLFSTLPLVYSLIFLNLVVLNSVFIFLCISHKFSIGFFFHGILKNYYETLEVYIVGTYVCVSICACVPCMHVAYVGFRGQFEGVSSVLIPRRSQGLHSSHHTWKQALLPTEPSLQPRHRVYKWRILVLLLSSSPLLLTILTGRYL